MTDPKDDMVLEHEHHQFASPRLVYETLRDLAGKENVSINQLITLAVAEKISALAIEEYLGVRAKRASRKKFLRAMAKVPDVEPDHYDRL